MASSHGWCHLHLMSHQRAEYVFFLKKKSCIRPGQGGFVRGWDSGQARWCVTGQKSSCWKAYLFFWERHCHQIRNKIFIVSELKIWTWKILACECLLYSIPWNWAGSMFGYESNESDPYFPSEHCNESNDILRRPYISTISGCFQK